MTVKFFVTLVFMASATHSLAGNEPGPKQKSSSSSYKSRLHEDEPSTETFSAKVKVVRSVQEDTEVFFESDKNKGAFLLPSNLKDFDKYKSRLQKSQTVGGPQVSVTADQEKRIQNVEIEEQKITTPTSSPWE